MKTKTTPLALYSTEGHMQSQQQEIDFSPTTLELPPNHPGIHDAEYCQRRQHLFKQAREYRLQNKGIPEIEYTEAEQALWRKVATELVALHEKHACQLYLTGKQQLDITIDEIPQLASLAAKLEKGYGLGIVIAEGLLDGRDFFHYLRRRLMPCTQFLRHHSVPAYTPEPDVIHDVLGHVPALVDAEYAEIVALLGEGIARAHANPRQVQAWERLYWFTLEFGLVEEANQLKVLGSGILSSIEEIPYSLSSKVEHRPFVLEKVVATPYDPTQLQDIIYIIPPLAELKQEVRRFLEEFPHIVS